MLRALALVLLVGNALLLGAQFGLFDGLTGGGDAAALQREPQRLQRQVHPELVRVLAPPAASAALAAAAASAAQAADAASRAAALECLEAGPFNAADAEAAERTLRDAGLAAGAWQADRREDPGAFLVYMGKYPDREALQRKLEEIRRLKLDAEELRGQPDLQPGLALGRFDRKADAEAALSRMAQRGVRTARVVTLRPAQSQTVLRVPAADAATRARLAGLRLPSGPGFAACEVTADAAVAASAAASASAPASGAASAPAARAGGAASAAPLAAPASAGPSATSSRPAASAAGASPAPARAAATAAPAATSARP